MHVQNIGVVSFQALQGRVDFLHHPAARVMPHIDALIHLVAQLGRQHPVVPLTVQNLTDHGFRRAFGVHIGCIDVVHTVGMRVSDDVYSLGFVRLVAKHHGAQAQGGDL